MMLCASAPAEINATAVAISAAAALRLAIR
jgi:hypothetical protein